MVPNEQKNFVSYLSIESSIRAKPLKLAKNREKRLFSKFFKPSLKGFFVVLIVRHQHYGLSRFQIRRKIANMMMLTYRAMSR